MCPQSTRSLLISQRGAPPLDADQTWERWCSAAARVAETLRAALPVASAKHVPELDALWENVPERHDLTGLAQYQRRLGEAARHLETDLEHAGEIAGLAAMAGWREPYADMVTELAKIRHLSNRV